MKRHDDRGTFPVARAHSVNVPRIDRQPVVGPVIQHETPVRTHATTVVGRRDLVRWGPVWAGLVVTLSTFLLLELVFFALGVLSLAQGEPGSTAGWMSGLIGLVAFFLGGLTAGATAMWRSARDGALQGFLVWALTTMGIMFLTLFGGGALFGSAAEVLTQVSSIQRSDLPAVDAASAIDTARAATNWAVLGLVLALLAAAIGGAVGGKLWPGKNNDRRATSH